MMSDLPTPSSFNSDTRKLLEKNLVYSREILRTQRQIKNYVLWGRIMSLIYLIIILAPLVLGLIYLPDIIKKLYANFLPGGTSAQGFNLNSFVGDDGSLNLEKLLKEGGLEKKSGNLDPYYNFNNN